MTQLKHFTQITPLVSALVFTNSVLAADPITDENKNNSSGYTLSAMLTMLVILMAALHSL